VASAPPFRQAAGYRWLKPGGVLLFVIPGEDAQCFCGILSIACRKPIRYLVAISAELAKTRPGADRQGRRTILGYNDPTFVLCRISQRFGLPVVPEWAAWFNEEPLWSDQTAYRPGMLTGAGHRHEEG
jgi:hypothetical protein